MFVKSFICRYFAVTMCVNNASYSCIINHQKNHYHENIKINYAERYVIGSVRQCKSGW